VTHFKVLERFKSATLLELRLETGRTHQIRVHMSYIGHPLVGDMVYGRKKQTYGFEGQALHARLLGFVHPGNGRYVEFTAEPPQCFKELVERLRKER
jgi:23S rRNA pseudouridine1911/1915/1917 synthase